MPESLIGASLAASRRPGQSHRRHALSRRSGQARHVQLQVVFAGRPHARILAIDANEALASTRRCRGAHRGRCALSTPLA